MKNNILIGLLTFIWLVLMADIIWQGTDGKWTVGDAEKIGQLEVAKYTDQIMVVAVSEDGARLCLYEKETGTEHVRKTGVSQVREDIGRKENAVSDAEGSKWVLVFETEAIIGKNGLGKTKEGDGKTPVGVFVFVEAFGILENPGTKMSYTKVDETHYWVDDSTSGYYNQLVSTDVIKKDWISAEHVIDFGESYHYVLATSYNMERIPGKGSAVFLHCTSQESEVTAGCIAVPEQYMKKIMKRVNSHCVLIIDTKDNILSY